MQDKATMRIAAASLGLVVMLVIIGAIWLASKGQELPGVVAAIGSSAATALGGLFIFTGSKPADG